MNTFWLKVAAGVVALVAIIIIVGAYLPKGGEKPQPQKTVYDVWEQDDKRLDAKPQFNPPAVGPNQLTQQQVTQQQVARQPVVVEQPKPKFRELSEEEKIEAERLWEWVKAQRKMGRLPMLSYKQMVDNCREIIRRWPDSEYAFMAKRALADIPERYQQMYNITKEEIDLGNLK